MNGRGSLTHADDTINDIHKSHPAAPRPVDMDNFTFKPMPKTRKNITTVPPWNDGKLNVDEWSLSICTIPNIPSRTSTPTQEVVHTPSPPFPLTENDENETIWSAIPIEDWNIPDPNRPPSPPKPPPRGRNPVKQEHASMHWSFCKLDNCRFHRGENSWSY